MTFDGDDRFEIEGEKTPSAPRAFSGSFPRWVLRLAILSLMITSGLKYHFWLAAERRAAILARACQVGVGPLEVKTASVVNQIGPEEFELVADRTEVHGNFKGVGFRAWKDRSG